MILIILLLVVSPSLVQSFGDTLPNSIPLIRIKYYLEELSECIKATSSPPPFVGINPYPQNWYASYRPTLYFEVKNGGTDFQYFGTVNLKSKNDFLEEVELYFEDGVPQSRGVKTDVFRPLEHFEEYSVTYISGHLIVKNEEIPLITYVTYTEFSSEINRLIPNPDREIREGPTANFKTFDVIFGNEVFKAFHTFRSDTQRETVTIPHTVEIITMPRSEQVDISKPRLFPGLIYSVDKQQFLKLHNFDLRPPYNEYAFRVYQNCRTSRSSGRSQIELNQIIKVSFESFKSNILSVKPDCIDNHYGVVNYSKSDQTVVKLEKVCLGRGKYAVEGKIIFGQGTTPVTYMTLGKNDQLFYKPLEKDVLIPSDIEDIQIVKPDTTSLPPNAIIDRRIDYVPLSELQPIWNTHMEDMTVQCSEYKDSTLIVNIRGVKFFYTCTLAFVSPDQNRDLKLFDKFYNVYTERTVCTSPIYYNKDFNIFSREGIIPTMHGFKVEPVLASDDETLTFFATDFERKLADLKTALPGISDGRFVIRIGTIDSKYLVAMKMGYGRDRSPYYYYNGNFEVTLNGHSAHTNDITRRGTRYYLTKEGKRVGTDNEIQFEDIKIKLPDQQKVRKGELIYTRYYFAKITELEYAIDKVINDIIAKKFCNCRSTGSDSMLQVSVEIFRRFYFDTQFDCETHLVESTVNQGDLQGITTGGQMFQLNNVGLTFGIGPYRVTKLRERVANDIYAIEIPRARNQRNEELLGVGDVVLADKFTCNYLVMKTREYS